MKHFELSGTVREAGNKAVIKAIRKEGLVPCNLYGLGMENVLFTVSDKDLKGLICTPASYIVDLVLDNGKKYSCILHELQFHPVTDALLHVDFYEVNEVKPITIGIPVRLNGLAQGVRDGGRINLSIRKINVTAPYKSIPEHLDIDVTNLQLGKSIKVGELSFEGLTLSTPADVVVCSVKATRASRSAAAAAAQ